MLVTPICPILPSIQASRVLFVYIQDGDGNFRAIDLYRQLVGATLHRLTAFTDIPPSQAIFEHRALIGALNDHHQCGRRFGLAQALVQVAETIAQLLADKGTKGPGPGLFSDMLDQSLVMSLWAIVGACVDAFGGANATIDFVMPEPILWLFQQSNKFKFFEAEARVLDSWRADLDAAKHVKAGLAYAVRHTYLRGKGPTFTFLRAFPLLVAMGVTDLPAPNCVPPLHASRQCAAAFGEELATHQIVDGYPVECLEGLLRYAPSFMALRPLLNTGTAGRENRKRFPASGRWPDSVLASLGPLLEQLLRHTRWLVNPPKQATKETAAAPSIHPLLGPSCDALVDALRMHGSAICTPELVAALVQNDSLSISHHRNRDAQAFIRQELVMPVLECFCVSYAGAYDGTVGLEPTAKKALASWSWRQSGTSSIAELHDYWKQQAAGTDAAGPVSAWGRSQAKQGKLVPTRTQLLLEAAQSGITLACDKSKKPLEALRCISVLGQRTEDPTANPLASSVLSGMALAARRWFRARVAIARSDNAHAQIDWAEFESATGISDHFNDFWHVPVVAALLTEVTEDAMVVPAFEDWGFSGARGTGPPLSLFWLGFQQWAASHRQKLAVGAQRGELNSVNSIASQLQQVVSVCHARLTSGRAVPGDVRYISEAVPHLKAMLYASWAASGVRDGDILFQGLERFVAESKRALDTLATVCTRYCPSPRFGAMTEQFQKTFEATSLADIAVFLHFEKVSAARVFVMQASEGQLPSVLVGARDWLDRLQSSNLFNTFWAQSQPKTGGLDDAEMITQHILETQVKWNAFAGQLSTRLVKLAELDGYKENLVRSELEAIADTAPLDGAGVPGVFIVKLDAAGKEQSTAWAIDMEDILTQYKQLSLLKMNLPIVQKTLLLLGPWMTNAGRSELNTLATRLDHMHAKMAGDWLQSSLLSVGGHLSAIQKSQASLSAIGTMFKDTVFLEALGATVPLLNWLRADFMLEQNFVSARERVSNMEKTLLGSKLRNNLDAKLAELFYVRQALFDFIYRDAESFSSLNELLDQLDNLRGCFDDTALHAAMFSCQELTLDFAQVMSGNTDDLAPTRLMAYLAPELNTRWVLQMPPEPTQARPRGSPWTIQDCLHMISEIDGVEELVRFDALVEFQSSLVLAKGGMGDANIATSIEKWLAQFWRMQDINRALFNLHNSGHFAYVEVALSFSVFDTANGMLEQKIALAVEFSDWELEVEAARAKYYFLNFLVTKQITFLRAVLNDETTAADNLQKLVDVLRPLNTKLQKDKINSSTGSFKRVSDEGTTREKLEAIGAWLDELVGAMPPNTRPFSSDIQGDAMNFLSLESFVNMAVVTPVDDLVLLAYAAAGHVPEWPELLLCSATTTWEEVKCFCLRWQHAGKNGRVHRLYCLAKADSLPDAIQRQALAFILDAERYVGTTILAKLLIINEQDDGPLCNDLNHRRVRVYRPLPISSDDGGLSLRMLSEIVTKQFVGTVRVYSGNRPGCGKSFQIRVDAGANIDVWSIHKELKSKEMLEALPRGSDTPLHVRISTTVHKSLNDLLFQMTIVGCVVDPYNLVGKVWDNPSQIFIEVPSISIMHNLRTCQILPSRVVNAESFCADEQLLQVGMGTQQFLSNRFDGTVGLASTAQGTAYVRLQYVCKALQLIEIGDNLRKEESAFTSLGALDGPACFYLLSKWSKQGNHPSYISMWSYVNVLYFQFKAMHHPSSIFNMILATFTSRVPNMKNSVMKFMIDTTLDFAPRAPAGLEVELDRTASGKRRYGEKNTNSGVVAWNESNHNFLLQQAGGKRGGFTLLARDQDKLKAAIDSKLYNELYVNRLLDSVGEDKGQLAGDFLKILSKVTGIDKGEATKQELLSGRFCMTYDTILKTVAIYIRIRCGIPVVLMGECGCGKTALLRFICDYLGVPLHDLDIHGGTTRVDIINHIRIAEATGLEAFVFLDEINTCGEMGLLTEIIVSRTIFGKPISENLTIVAALNPYRLKPPELQQETGLVFNLHTGGGDITPDPMAALVYKVFPVPGTLMEYCFDYGALEDEIEQLYVNAIVEKYLPKADSDTRKLLVRMISVCQVFLRKVHSEVSVVSLRDVDRAIRLMGWFAKTGRSEALAAERKVFEAGFSSTNAHPDAVYPGTPFVTWLQGFRPKTEEGMLGGQLSAVENFPETGDLKVLLEFCKGPDFAPALPGRIRPAHAKWMATKAILSKQFLPIHGFLTFEVDIAVTALEVNTDDTAAEVIIEQRQSPNSPEGAVSQTVLVKWGNEHEANRDTDNVIHKRGTIRLQHPFARVMVKGGKGCIHLTATATDRATNVRVEDKAGVISDRIIVLGLAHVYYYRLADITDRDTLVHKLTVTATRNRPGFEKPGHITSIINAEQEAYIHNMVVEEGIAKNRALKENLFVVLTCILNHIPVMVVGKPGTSKTLCLQLILENLRGAGSPNPFWQQFPSITVFPYQCSPLSTAASIQSQYDAAVRFQEGQGGNSITVLLLDEIGLAEFSPDMPLKVLHAMLLSKTVAIVGISNWMLDPAKMNRAVCLRRPDPPKDDLRMTGLQIIGADIARRSGVEPKLAAMSEAYHAVYTNQGGRDYLGMRDFYNMLKFLGRELRRPDVLFDDFLLNRALCRNFGGKPMVMDKVLDLFTRKCATMMPLFTPNPVLMVSENLRDPHSRHLMVLTHNSAAWSILKNLRMVDPESVVLLIGSEFPGDSSELQLIQQLNTVKRAMAIGNTLVLINNDNIYEALYDVLNQRYVKERSKTGEVRRMLRVAVGMRSALCPVHDNFKLIAVVEAKHAYEALDLPLLNRFEKQVLVPSSVLTAQQIELVAKLNAYLRNAATLAGIAVEDMFVGFERASTLASLVLKLELKECTQETLDAGLRGLIKVASPLAVIKTPTFFTYKQEYFAGHASFGKHFATEYLGQKLADVASTGPKKLDDSDGSIEVILTRSPEAHVDEALQDGYVTTANVDADSCVLSNFNSSDAFRERVREFHNSFDYTPGLLVVQCDPIGVSHNQMQHAIIICREEAKLRANKGIADIDTSGDFVKRLYDSEEYSVQKALSEGRLPSFPRHVVFMVHLPPGMRSRQRRFPLNFLLADMFFLDDLRAVKQESLTSEKMLFSSPYELISDGHIALWQRVSSKYRAALTRLRIPYPSSADAVKHGVHLYPHRMKVMQTLLKNKRFETVVTTLMCGVLERQPFRTDPPLHAKLAITPGRSMGSLRESLELAMDEILIQVLARVLARLERNFGLHILASAIEDGGDQSPKVALWWQMNEFAASSLEGVSPEDLMDGSRIEVVNDGARGDIFIAQFPASFSIINFMDTEHIREALIKQHGQSPDGPIKMVESLGASFRMRFGDKIADSVKGVGRASKPDSSLSAMLQTGHADYLKDYLNIRAQVFPNLTNMTQLHVFACLIENYGSGGMQSLSAIHVSLWLNEKRAFHYCSIIAMASRFSLDDLTADLTKQLAPPGGQPAAAGPSWAHNSKAIAACDKRLVAALLSFVVSNARKWLTGDVKMWLKWLNVMDATELHIEALLILLGQENETYQLGLESEIAIILQQWSGVRVLKTFVEEVALPVTALGTDPGEFIEALREVQALTPSCETHTFNFMGALCKCVVTICGRFKVSANDAAKLMASFVQRYLTELVFAPNSRLPEGEVIDFCMDLVKGVSVLLPPTAARNNPLRRSILYTLFDSGETNLTKATKKKVKMSLVRYPWSEAPSDEVPDYTALQLYGSFSEFEIRNDLRVACVDVSGRLPSTIDGSMVTAHAESRKTLLPGIENFIQARVALHDYALACLKSMENGSMSAPLAEPEVLQLMSLADEPMWRLFFLRVFYGEGGIGMLKTLLENRTVLAPWLRLFPSLHVGADHVTPEVNVQLAFDPFGLFEHQQGLAVDGPDGPDGVKIGYQVLNFAFENALAIRAERQVPEFQRNVGDAVLSKPKTAALIFPASFKSVYTRLADPKPEAVIACGASLNQHLSSVCGAFITESGKAVLDGLLQNFPGCPTSTGGLANLFRVTPASMADQFLKVQTIIELFTSSWLQRANGCFFWKCLVAPDTLKEEFIPTMPANEMKMILGAKVRDIKMWYTCINGHPFSIGNCGLAMVTAKCHCGAQIGGSDHKLKHGKKVDINALANADVPGYIKEHVQSAGSEDIMRDTLTPLAVRVCRLFFHGMLALSSAIGNGAKVATLLGFSTTAQADEFVVEHFNADWEAVKKNAELNNDNAALFLSAVLANARNKASALNVGSFSDSQARERWERAFFDCVKPLVTGDKVKQSIEQYNADVARHCPTDQKTSVLLITGPDLWSAIQKSSDVPDRKLPLERLLLRYAVPATFLHFQRAFSMNPENAARCPTLALISALEEDLSLIKYLPAVLSWHAVLFEAFQDGLSREAAEEITNDEVIDRLDDSKQSAARKLFALFSDGFNAIIPTINNIFECQRNPFKEMEMNGSTKVVFSLPDQSGLPGCCTIQILDKLHKAHNDVVIKYSETIQSDNNSHPSRNTNTPMVDCRTPASSLRASIIEYDREEHLLPLVTIHSVQGLAYDEGDSISYDFPKIEQTVTARLLKDKSPINIAIRRFVYKGELAKGNTLAALGNVIPQQELQQEVKDAIGNELDTQYNTRKLLNFLEEVVEFLVSVSRGAVGEAITPPHTVLKTYAVQVMAVEKEEFERVSCLTVSDNILVCHLQSLFLFLEENANGSFLDKILPQYRETLSPEQRDDVVRSQAVLDMNTLLPAMREVMISAPGLMSDPGPGTHLKLRDFLDWVESGEDYMSDIASYNDNFPHSLTVGTCLAAFQIYSSSSVEHVREDGDDGDDGDVDL